MRQLVFTMGAVSIGLLVGWSAAHIEATTAGVNLDALNVRIAEEIKLKLADDPLLRHSPLDVTVEIERELVTISGLVNSPALHRHALEALAQTKKDYTLRDKIVVQLPRDEFTVAQAERQRAAARATGEIVGSAVSDAWIHSDISARLRSNPATAAQSALHIDVVDGNVTLRGFVSSPEQKIAAGQVAADTDGVAAINNQLKTVVESGKPYRTSVG